MKKIKQFLASEVVTAAAFVLAAGLLLFSSVGGARAALTSVSDTYTSEIELHEIGVALLENGNEASGNGGLLRNMLQENQELKLGEMYPEALQVRNAGRISQYVRVNIHKYWKEPATDEAPGAKSQKLSPELIRLMLGGKTLGTDEGNAQLRAAGWEIDERASTQERMVLYYKYPLTGTDEGEAGASTLFMDQISISEDVAKQVEKRPVEGKPGSFRITYAYDGYEFCLDVKVDAVQDHNAQDAILSAWGRKVVIGGDGTLSLANGQGAGNADPGSN